MALISNHILYCQRAVLFLPMEEISGLFSTRLKPDQSHLIKMSFKHPNSHRPKVDIIKTLFISFCSIRSHTQNSIFCCYCHFFSPSEVFNSLIHLTESKNIKSGIMLQVETYLLFFISL